MKKITKNGKNGEKRKASAIKKAKHPVGRTPRASINREPPIKRGKNNSSTKGSDKKRAELRQRLEELQKVYSFYKGNLSDLIIADRK